MADSADRTTIDFRRLRAAPLPEAPSDDADYVPVLTVSGSDKTVTWSENTVAAVGAVTALTNSTGATANNTVENVPAVVAAAGEATAADLTTTQAAFTAVENDISDLAAKVNEIIAAAAG
jgi:hypothetical protein